MGNGQVDSCHKIIRNCHGYSNGLNKGSAYQYHDAAHDGSDLIEARLELIVDSSVKVVVVVVGGGGSENLTFVPCRIV